LIGPAFWRTQSPSALGDWATPPANLLAAPFPGGGHPAIGDAQARSLKKLAGPPTSTVDGPLVFFVPLLTMQFRPKLFFRAFVAEACCPYYIHHR
jgi:hypothetical protein